MVARPYGSWTSPNQPSDLVVAEAIRLDQVALDGDAIYWTESQPQKQGRCFVYRANPGGEREAVTPDDANAFNVRTRVHEYGGGAFRRAGRHRLLLELCRPASLSPGCRPVPRAPSRRRRRRRARCATRRRDRPAARPPHLRPRRPHTPRSGDQYAGERRPLGY